MSRVRCALISVSDKRGLDEFARGLELRGITIISTGGTAEYLRNSGIKVNDMEEFTGSPELLDGRVKTLHPRIHAGILASRGSEAHRLEMQRMGWGFIDMVVVNLPEPPTCESVDAATLMKRMDIGGHALLRAAVKNFRDVVVLCNPAKYGLVLGELSAEDGGLTEGLRARLAREALEAAARYDAIYLRCLGKMVGPAKSVLPVEITISLPRAAELRYGENAHQKAAVYRAMDCGEPSLLGASVLNGKELSFNNYVDLDAALEIVKGFQGPACAIVKHSNPCGVALGENGLQAFRRARATDPDSAFGGIVAFNVPVGEDTARELTADFLECVVAPSFDGAALSQLKGKKNLRVLDLPHFTEWRKKGGMRDPRRELRQITGGLLLQDCDFGSIGLGDLRHVTERKPTAGEAAAIFFSWSVVRQVRSNAIVIATAEETVGIGAGQMSRVDSVRLAIAKARKPVDGCVAASDGFFPFRDSIDELAQAGVRTIVQPGGSIRDKDVIEECNDRGVAMVFTGMRCFKH